MRVSERYKLNRKQPSLDFVDVDTTGDLAVFIDPRALRLLQSRWSDECVSLIQDFFQSVLVAIKENRNADARRLLLALREPNETHLGLSRGRSRGRALGIQSAREVWKALSKSEAVKSGLLEDLEDTILMIEGIDADIVSDISTNIIRGPLIQYTQDICDIYGIPLVEGVNSGPLWDPSNKRWYSELVRLPIAASRRLLLVPKVIVRRRMDYDQDEYYRHYLLEYLAEVELKANTELVHLLKDGSPRVTKKDLEKKYGSGKSVIVRETLRHPEILERYRSDKRHHIRPPLTHTEIAETSGTELPDWDELFNNVRVVPTGIEHARQYEVVVEQLLTALFYPSLANPQIQHAIHEGRKRIDITYTNAATMGFFLWLATHYSAAHVFVECKNYGRDVSNPELDQLAGRFSPSRGQFGLLICRSFENKPLFLRRCRDTAMDRRGFIIPLDDDDLGALTNARKNRDELAEFRYLKQLFDALIM
jgi:hypothetical protein